MLEGLDRVSKAPLGGFVEVTSAMTLQDWLVRGEVGWKPRENISVFGFGEVGARWGQPVTAMAGIGARVTF